MAETELSALKDLKIKLLARTEELLQKLREQEGNDQQLKTLKVSDVKIDNSQVHLHPQYHQLLCKVSQKISGITFENVDRKWLKDSRYCYTAYLVTKAVKFFLELTVDLGSGEEFEIQNIMCHFTNINRCYMMEMELWVQNITRKKNFALLTSAFSQYSDKYIFRSKIVNGLEAEKYIKWEECVDENGGILMHVCSPENPHQVYLKFQWSLIFLDRSWQIEHYFNITPDATEIKFAMKNHVLLKRFCKRSIKNKNVIDLFDELCSAVDRYKNNYHTKVKKQKLYR